MLYLTTVLIVQVLKPVIARAFEERRILFYLGV